MVDVGRIRIVRVAAEVVCLADAEAIRSIGGAVLFDARNQKCEFRASLAEGVAANENVAAASAEVAVGESS